MIQQFVLRRIKRTASVLALSAIAFSTVACSGGLEDSNADVPVPEDQAAVPAEAEVGGGDADVGELIGETVTVSTKVTEVLSPNLFTIYDLESLRGEKDLVAVFFRGAW